MTMIVRIREIWRVSPESEAMGRIGEVGRWDISVDGDRSNN